MLGKQTSGIETRSLRTRTSNSKVQDGEDVVKGGYYRPDDFVRLSPTFEAVQFDYFFKIWPAPKSVLSVRLSWAATDGRPV